MTRAPVIERRTAARLVLKGSALLRAPDYSIHTRVVNVATGGLLVASDVTVPSRLLGRTVHVDLRLDAADASWQALEGRVLRIGANAVALCFPTVPDSFVRILGEMTSASQRNTRTLSVVLVDREPLRRVAFEEAFREVGCDVISVSTPLEAIVRLGESSFEPDLIAIADSAPTSISNELRVFVERNHPRARLVSITEALDAPGTVPDWLSAADPSHDLAARIRSVLASPLRAR